MTKETLIRIHRIYSILLSIVIILAGLCFIAGCITIYNSGDHPFSREVVAETFSGIALPVYLCLAMTIISFLLEAILPSNKEKPTIQKPYTAILNRLRTNKDSEKLDPKLKDEILALQKNRRLHIIIRTIVIILSSVCFLVYALNGKHFHQSDINGSMIKAMWLLIPCFFLSFGYALFTAIHNEKSIQKEIGLWKQVPSSAPLRTDKDTASDTSDKKLNTCRLAFLFVAVFCLTYGLLTGGTADVLTKAINICTECIGLG